VDRRATKRAHNLGGSSGSGGQVSAANVCSTGQDSNDKGSHGVGGKKKLKLEKGLLASAADNLKKAAADLKNAKQEATKCLGKISAEHIQLEAMTKDRLFKTMPELIKGKIADTLKQMKEMQVDCKSVLAKGGSLTSTVETAANLAKTSALQRAFVNQLQQNQMAMNMPAC